MRHSFTSAVTLSLFIGVACQTTVNIGTDTSEEDTETASGSTAGTGDSTGNLATSNPGTTDPNTSEPGTTDGNTTNPGTTDGNTTNPGTTDGSTTNPNTTDTSGDTSGGPDTDSTGSSTGGTTGGDADLGDWTKYREVLIDNGLSEALTDFQVAVEVTYDADMSPDYADLRFTDESGTQLLPYWIEWEQGPVKAYIWVRVPVIAADDITTIRMYYGNANASAGSNGFDTFLFFDDFEAGALDAAKWKTTAPVAVEFGRLKITKGAVYSAKTLAAFPNTTIEVRAVWANENVSDSRIVVGQAQQQLPDLIDISTGWYTSVWDGEKTILAKDELMCSTDTMKIFGISVGATDIYPRCNRYYSPPIDLGVAFSYYLTLGHGWGKIAEQNETKDMDVDWVLVRRHAKPDPVTLVGGEKQP